MNDTIMHKKNDKKIIILIIVILPILSPYSLMGASLSLIFVMGLLIYFLLKYKGTYMHNSTGLLLMFMFLVTLIDVIFTNKNLNTGLAIKVLIVFCIYIFMFSNFWHETENAEMFYKIAVMIGKVCAILAILQFVFVSLGYANFYNGKLPLPLEKYSAFAALVDPITGALRVHSFFEEPSYLAIFELPIFAYLFQQEDYVWSILIAFSCIVSGSALGILGIIIVTIALFWGNTLSLKRRIQFLLLLGLILIIGMVLLSKFSALERLVNYYMTRYLDIGRDFTREDSSISQRLIGNYPLFSKYNLFNKFWGVGINQYPIYFGLSTDYSNDFVTILLNFGYIGSALFIMWLINLVRKSQKDKYIFFIIFLIVLLIDHSWFSDNFFYLLSWLVLGKNNHKMQYFKLNK